MFARIQVPAEELPRVRSATGVAYVLPRAAQPAVLPDGLVEAVRLRASKPVDDAPASGLKRGDRVTVVSGPFRWVEALFDRHLSGRGRIRVLLDMVHGSAALEVEADAIRPLKLPGARALLRTPRPAERQAALV
jgi:transcription antitermination factor NusG